MRGSCFVRGPGDKMDLCRSFSRSNLRRSPRHLSRRSDRRRRFVSNPPARSARGTAGATQPPRRRYSCGATPAIASRRFHPPMESFSNRRDPLAAPALARQLSQRRTKSRPRCSKPAGSAGSATISATCSSRFTHVQKMIFSCLFSSSPITTTFVRSTERTMTRLLKNLLSPNNPPACGLQPACPAPSPEMNSNLPPSAASTTSCRAMSSRSISPSVSPSRWANHREKFTADSNNSPARFTAPASATPTTHCSAIRPSFSCASHPIQNPANAESSPARSKAVRPNLPGMDRELRDSPGRS